jgi:hypothetical protein
MELGEMIASGPPSQVLGNPRVVAAYLGASESVVARSGTETLTDLLKRATMDTGDPRAR